LKKLSVVLLVLTVIFLFASCAKKPEYIDYSKQNIQFAQSLTDAKAIVYADKSFGSKTNVETRSGENKALFKITTADDIKELNIYGKGYKWDVDNFLQISQREFFMRIHTSERLPETRSIYLSNPTVIYTDVTNPASPVMYEFPNMNIIKAQRVDDAIYFIATNQGFLKFDIPSKQIITVIPNEILKNIDDFYFIGNDYVTLFYGGDPFLSESITPVVNDLGWGKIALFSIKEQKIYRYDNMFGMLFFRNGKILCYERSEAYALWFDTIGKKFDSKFLRRQDGLRTTRYVRYSNYPIRPDDSTLCFARCEQYPNKYVIDEIKFDLTDEPTSTVVRSFDNPYYFLMLYFKKSDVYLTGSKGIVYKINPNTSEITKLYDLSDYNVFDYDENASDLFEKYYYSYDDDYIYFSGYDNITPTKYRCNILTGVIEVTESNPVEPIIVIPFN